MPGSALVAHRLHSGYARTATDRRIRPLDARVAQHPGKNHDPCSARSASWWKPGPPSST